ncbi:hypothetical protein PoB_004613300 [Plakobranchus ocellatus]|uniref:Uncharacterized protein n=1 Tax=Plakobranchus ocellatus TaxID=259542 RepID=A0AAV4BJ70_9GAST|nr:hypothetical protein PoB_004613300 [Plakobranchus ocellatus]
MYLINKSLDDDKNRDEWEDNCYGHNLETGPYESEVVESLKKPEAAFNSLYNGETRQRHCNPGPTYQQEGQGVCVNQSSKAGKEDKGHQSKVTLMAIYSVHIKEIPDFQGLIRSSTEGQVPADFRVRSFDVVLPTPPL